MFSQFGLNFKLLTKLGPEGKEVIQVVVIQTTLIFQLFIPLLSFRLGTHLPKATFQVGMQFGKSAFDEGQHSKE